MDNSVAQIAEGPLGPPGGGSSDGPGDPHGALFLVLGYLRLPDLLASHRVCRSFREAIAGDTLLWREVAVEPPLSGRLTDDALLEVTSRAGGTLRTLSLLSCWRVTDAGLQRVVDEKPGITKLHVPGCIHLTADGVVRAVKSLADGHNNKGSSLKQLRINGVPNITKEHLGILNSILFKVHPDQQQNLPPSFYSDWSSPAAAAPNGGGDGRPIDVDICPWCDSPRLVFDCPRERCRTTKGRWGECRGCVFCIARCGVCAGCVGFQELGEESACAHLLCLECWLRLPKCNMCNRPYCPGHGSPQAERFRSAGFVCEECQRYEASFTAPE